jgi:hypothetical protein
MRANGCNIAAQEWSQEDHKACSKTAVTDSLWLAYPGKGFEPSHNDCVTLNRLIPGPVGLDVVLPQRTRADVCDKAAYPLEPPTVQVRSAVVPPVLGPVDERGPFREP